MSAAGLRMSGLARLVLDDSTTDGERIAAARALARMVLSSGQSAGVSRRRAERASSAEPTRAARPGTPKATVPEPPSAAVWGSRSPLENMVAFLDYFAVIAMNSQRIDDSGWDHWARTASNVYAEVVRRNADGSGRYNDANWAMARARLDYSKAIAKMKEWGVQIPLIFL